MRQKERNNNYKYISAYRNSIHYNTDRYSTTQRSIIHPYVRTYIHTINKIPLKLSRSILLTPRRKVDNYLDKQKGKCLPGLIEFSRRDEYPLKFSPNIKQKRAKILQPRGGNDCQRGQACM